MLIDTFINAIFLYDDKMVITFNYKEGTKTITLAELQEAISNKNGSDLDCLAHHGGVDTLRAKTDSTTGCRFLLAIRRLLCYSVDGASALRRCMATVGVSKCPKSLVWSIRAYIAQAIVSPCTYGGSFCPPMKGGLLMSTNEVLQLCIVIIGICNLFIQAYKKK